MENWLTNTKKIIPKNNYYSKHKEDYSKEQIPKNKDYSKEQILFQIQKSLFPNYLCDQLNMGTEDFESLKILAISTSQIMIITDLRACFSCWFQLHPIFKLFFLYWSIAN